MLTPIIDKVFYREKTILNNTDIVMHTTGLFRNRR